MAILKCKMCGGDLALTEGQSVAECEYCGSRQTVPSADNEKKLTLFARADRLRSSCEFDKAAGIYESIVADFPKEAEAYWGLVLCKYGIEYVDDPATGKKIPTCHRSSYDSVLDDGDFAQVMLNGDPVSRRVYLEEAKQIDEICRKIVAVSAKEAPYDIFICYKETDENGDRTLDSVLAQDIYDALTEKRYRVFFSRISLEDKIGQEYEPYIFSALNSAKIMLAVGTSYEHYNAVWVKNEWSRFLKMMSRGEKKYLIPCYKNLDAYDMPREFQRLQAQDIGKVGAIQDLLRGIGKLMPQRKEMPVNPPRPAQRTTRSSDYPGGKRVKCRICGGKMEVDPSAKTFACKYCNTIHSLTGDVMDELREMLARGRKNETIKRIRELCGIETKQAKALADQIEQTGTAELPKKSTVRPPAPAPQPQGGGNRQQPQTNSYAPAKPSAPKNYRDQQMTAEALRLRLSKSRVCEKEGFMSLNTGGLTATQFFTNAQGQTEVYTCSAPFKALAFDRGTGQSLNMDTMYRCRWQFGRMCVFLKWDGRIFVFNSTNERFAQEVQQWTDIVDIAFLSDTLCLGLRSDGKVLAAVLKESSTTPLYLEAVQRWHDITSITVGGGYAFGLRADGRVMTAPSGKLGQVEKWEDIVSISCSKHYQIDGVKADGTVVACGFGDFRPYDVSQWKDVIAVMCCDSFTVGITKYGKVLRTMTFGYDSENGYSICRMPFYQPYYEIAGMEIFRIGPMTTVQTTMTDIAKIRQKWMGQNVDGMLVYQLEILPKIQGLQKQLSLKQAELNAANGMFAGKRRKELKEEIAGMEAQIRQLEALRR